MAGPYGRVCRDLFGQSLHIKGALVLDQNAKLTVPNACVDFISVTGNVITTGITEQEGQQGIRIIGNICMDTDFCIKSSKITETESDQGVWTKKGISYDKFGYGRAYIDTPHIVNKSGNTTQIIFGTKSFESVFTTTDNIIHPGSDTSKTFNAPSVADLNPPSGCTVGNIIVDTKITLQANIITGEEIDNVTFFITKNGDTVSPLVEYVHNITIASADDTIQSISFGDIIRINPDDVIDVYTVAGNVSGVLCVKIEAGSSKSFASFNILGFEL